MQTKDKQNKQNKHNEHINYKREQLIIIPLVLWSLYDSFAANP